MLTLTPSSIESFKTYLYSNTTSRFQIIRIENGGDSYFLERTVFPGQRVLVEAAADAILDVYAGPMMSTLLEDRIPCHQLPQALVTAESMSQPSHSELSIAA